MEPFIGQIIMFGGNFAPRGWAFCDGQLLPIGKAYFGFTDGEFFDLTFAREDGAIEYATFLFLLLISLVENIIFINLTYQINY